MGRANTSSIDTNEGEKIAILGKQNRLADQANFQPNEKSKNENIVNSNKAKIISPNQKAKAKAKAKLAKAQRKKNKKK